MPVPSHESSDPRELRSPVCVRCGAPNPRPPSDEDLDELVRFNLSYPAHVGQHVVNALRELGRAA